MKKEILFLIEEQEPHWVGNGFYVQTLFHPAGKMYFYTTPFILLDYAAPRRFEPTNEKRGVGEHPHRGFETVTLAFEGEVEHRDSAGGGGIIGKGDVQWMSAASGLVHEEFHSREFAKRGGVFEMVQLWVNLPKSHKMNPPRYQGVKAERFPLVEADPGVQLKVVAGEYLGHRGPCETFSPINLYDLRLEAKRTFKLDVPDGSTLLILNRKGLVKLGRKMLTAGQIAIFDRAGDEVEISSEEQAELLVLNGEPIDEPIAAQGPFVMNSREEVVQAIYDFQAGKMGILVETFK